MIARVRKIGNSAGVLISKSILEQCAIDKEVKIEIIDQKIVISPVSRKPRQGWEKQFLDADATSDKELLMHDIQNDFDQEEWTW